MNQKKSAKFLSVVGGDKRPAEDDEDGDEVASVVKKKPGLRAPRELDADGGKVWLKAATTLNRHGYSVTDYEESLMLMAYAWQRFMKKLKAGRDVRSAEVKALNNLLHEFGLSPTKKGGSVTPTPQKKSRLSRMTAMQKMKQDLEEDDEE